MNQNLRYRQLQQSRQPKIQNIILPSVAQYMKHEPQEVKKQVIERRHYRIQSKSNERITYSTSPKKQQKRANSLGQNQASQPKTTLYTSQKENHQISRQFMSSQELLMKLKNKSKNAGAQRIKTEEQEHSRDYKIKEIINKLSVETNNPSLKIRTEESERSNKKTEKILDLMFLSTQELKNVFKTKQYQRSSRPSVRIQIPRCHNAFPADFFTPF